MRVLLFGATGMIGKGTLLELLDDEGVDEVVAVVRKSAGVPHKKLRELVHADFAHYDGVDFAGFDACLFCLGISSAGMKEPEYTRITFDYAVAAAHAVKAASPNAVFCFISGEGTDANSKTMWARVKGKTENEIFRLFGERGFAFRPGFIKPERGVTPATTPGLKTLYTVLNPFIPALRLVLGNHMTTSVVLGQALVRTAKTGRAPKQILETVDINLLGAPASP